VRIATGSVHAQGCAREVGVNEGECQALLSNGGETSAAGIQRKAVETGCRGGSCKR